MPLTQTNPLFNNYTGNGPDGPGTFGGGTFVCNGTTAVVVADTRVQVGNVIVPGLRTVGGTVGAIPRVTTITPGVGFTIAGTASDTSTYNYVIL